jgi:hypothetical protein
VSVCEKERERERKRERESERERVRERGREIEREKGVKQIWDLNGDYQVIARPCALRRRFCNACN